MNVFPRLIHSLFLPRFFLVSPLRCIMECITQLRSSTKIVILLFSALFSCFSSRTVSGNKVLTNRLHNILLLQIYFPAMEFPCDYLKKQNTKKQNEQWVCMYYECVCTMLSLVDTLVWNFVVLGGRVLDQLYRSSSDNLLNHCRQLDMYPLFPG